MLIIVRKENACAKRRRSSASEMPDVKCKIRTYFSTNIGLSTLVITIVET